MSFKCACIFCTFYGTEKPFYFISLSDFLKKLIINGILISPVPISATGCEIWIPVRPKNVVVITSVGISRSPERIIERKEEIPAFLIL